MENRIRHISVSNRSLVPAQAEVWITVVPERLIPTTEIRGRLMGPRCVYSSTVEIAYPFRPLSPDQKPMNPAGLTVRTFIPEATLWEPQCPFLYQGLVELWQDDQLCDRVGLKHGLRSVQLNERGLHVNGKRLRLRGREVTSNFENEASALRQAGYNLLLAPIAENTLTVWEKANELGFFVLGQVRDDHEDTVHSLERLSRYPSCLGWLIVDAVHPQLDRFPPGCLLGLSDRCVSSGGLLEQVHFLVGTAELINRGKPLLMMGQESIPASENGLLLGSVA